MPTISMFYGILIRMYCGGREHGPPHIHALYGDKAAVFSIIDSEQIEGSLATPQRKLVEAWITLHRDELLADWALSESGELPFRIDPLR